MPKLESETHREPARMLKPFMQTLVLLPPLPSRAEPDKFTPTLNSKPLKPEIPEPLVVSSAFQVGPLTNVHVNVLL